MITRACLVMKPDHERKRKRTKTRHMQNKNPTRFCCKGKIKQGYNKKKTPKLMLNKLKVMNNSTFICTH